MLLICCAVGWRKIVGFADGKNLFQVMFAVNELELAPLIDVEGPQGGVAREFAGTTEEILCFGTELIEVSQVLGCGSGKLLTAELMGGWLGRHHEWGFAAVGEVAEMDEGVLAEMLGNAWFCARGCLLGEAGVQSQLCAGVAEQEVLHDLLDRPLVRTGGRLELCLSGVEPVEGESNLALKAVEG